MAKKKLTVEEKLALARQAIKKEYPEIRLIRGSEIQLEFAHTGIPQIDKVIRGFRRGGYSIIWGPDSCIDEDSFIQYNVRTSEGKCQSNKGGTIKRLYERFHGIPHDPPGKGYYMHPRTVNSVFTVPSVNKNNTVFHNQIVDVVKTGRKPCFCLTTVTGKKLTATADHKFLTEKGYVPLSDLKEGETVYIHNKTPYRGQRPYINRPEVLVKYHPRWKIKLIENKYKYHRGFVSWAVVEAVQNKLEYEEYIKILNNSSKEEINTLWYIPEGYDVRHIDHDPTNNSISNLQVIKRSEHEQLHATKNNKYLGFISVPDTIIAIESVGDRETYDIKCLAPNNNFIANGLVVHNSGKTSLVLYTIAQDQKKGKVCLYASIEARFDPGWAASLGVNLDELLIIEKGKSMEDTLMAIERLVKDGLIDTVAIDSVTALLPQQELEDKKDKEKTVHQDHMATQAKKFSQWFRRTTPLIAAQDTCMILVGQGRMEGFSQGMARLGLAGGKAQKYYSSTTLKIYRTNTGAPHIMVGEKRKYTGFVMCIILDKTSLTANEGKEVKLPFVFGVGLDLGRTEVDEALAAGRISMSSKGRFEWIHPETKELHKVHGKTNLYTFFGDEELLELLKKSEIVIQEEEE